MASSAAFRPLIPTPGHPPIHAPLMGTSSPADLYSERAAELGARIYTALESDATLRTGLKLDKEHSMLIKGTIIPRVLEARQRLLGSADVYPDLTLAISSKDPSLQFGPYGKANIRVKNGKTYIALPHMKSLEGSIKTVKFTIGISPDGNQISLEMMSKIKKKLRTPQRCEKYIAIANILKNFKHANILVPVDVLIPSAKKGYELITPKCETDLFDFIQKTIDTSIPLETQARDCIRYIREITSAMKYVYDRGYLHCDLKPENILLQKGPDGNLKAMLMDFDLLSKFDDPTQVLRGAKPYVPPSYIDSGKSNDITTELYALGKTLHDDPKKLTSFTMLLSKLEKTALSTGNERVSTAIPMLIREITFLSQRLTQDKISDYTTVLKELDAAAIQFETALATA